MATHRTFTGGHRCAARVKASSFRPLGPSPRARPRCGHDDGRVVPPECRLQTLLEVRDDTSWGSGCDEARSSCPRRSLSHEVASWIAACLFLSAAAALARSKWRVPAPPPQGPAAHAPSGVCQHCPFQVYVKSYKSLAVSSEHHGCFLAAMISRRMEPSIGPISLTVRATLSLGKQIRVSLHGSKKRRVVSNPKTGAISMAKRVRLTCSSSFNQCVHSPTSSRVRA